MKRKSISFMVLLLAFILTSCGSHNDDGITREE